ncbi:hypothetical protein HDU76_001189 [Blyttiomyces sp. JEL0837]|nr:hypothetical protein HDU76_001189 [Blyttiomyces sp. JEL0837]
MTFERGAIQGWDPLLNSIVFPTPDVAPSHEEVQAALDRLTSLGFPTNIEGPSAWTPQNYPQIFIHLTGEQINALLSAVTTFITSEKNASTDEKRSKSDLSKLSPTSFPLPECWNDVLAKMKDNLVGPGSTGAIVLKGFPVENVSLEEAAVAFMGIGSHIGAPVSQNGKGHLLGHVKDLGLDPNNPNTRLYATAQAQRFHVDSCDVVGLLCLHPAQSGGRSAVASSHTAWNTIIERGRPDLAVLLADPDAWYWDRKGEVPPGKLPYFKLPIFHLNNDGKVMCLYDRNFLRTIDRFADIGVPPLSRKQVEAMDALEAACVENSFEMDLERGDMQFVHNHSILHARTAFNDPVDSPTRRHLLRLWLSCGGEGQGGWALPEVYKERYGEARADGRRGGIEVPGLKERVVLFPE